MKLLTNGKDVFQDQKKVLDLRKAINTWINGIKNHNLENLGDKIEISSAYYKPSYCVGLITRYEKRILNFTQEPFTNQTVSKRVITSISQVNRWDYELTKTTENIPKPKIWKIPGSEEVTTCPKCSGKKQIKCPDCSNGRITCHICNGSGRLVCSSCNGKGYHRCSSCGGKGYTESHSTKTRTKYSSYGEMRQESYTETTKRNCKSCNGKGNHPCRSCGTTGYVRCRNCNGAGTVKCSTCHGFSQIICPVCSGVGQIIKYIQLEHSFEDKYHKYCKTYDSLNHSFPKLTELSKGASGFSLLHENKSSFQEKYLSNFPYIAQEYDKLHYETIQIVQESNNSIKINKQQLQVFEIPVYEVSYSYEEKNYTLLVYGGKQKIYAPISPLSKFADSVLKNAKRFYKTKQYSKSLEQLNKNITLNQENITKEVSDLKNKIVKHIHRDYKVGSVIGLIASIGLFTALVNLLSEHFYFIIPRVAKFYDEIITLPKVLPWVMAAIYAIFMIWFISKNSNYTIEKYGIKIKSSLFRKIVSIVNFLIFGLGISILIFLINSTGLLIPIASVAGYFFDKLIQ